MATLGTILFTLFFGHRVGTDSVGNRYYEERRRRPSSLRPRRWVVYRGLPEPTKVPPEWHAWLHYTTDAPLPETARKPWQKPHMMNLTGTPFSYRPPGHDYSGGRRPVATGDYEAWTPNA
ncbi:MAG: NADH:ubiquinone oxidoreductase subunit NDUFA12 [Acetobacteraceae bacterium]|nr:NADH:ubiquinone oxidoreductase subunit NDUFA12 [Acetobacteraceae bacterium]MBV8591670.1 NADH:ubiquinone oxidoreductase subunit NDUFA12 [Acetobacteraceae bacterium]